MQTGPLALTQEPQLALHAFPRRQVAEWSVLVSQEERWNDAGADDGAGCRCYSG